MIKIHSIPIIKDNYVWAIVYQNEAWIVDPGDHRPVIAFLTAQKLSLAGVLITHHHWDHITGCSPLVEHFGGDIPVIGPHHPKYQLVTSAIKDDERITIFDLEVSVIKTPGHTLDHVCYWIAQAQVLFSGDTLFNSGCGRIFDGSSERLFQSLNRLAALPPDTLVYCTHEYTLANLKFAKEVEPSNQAILSAEERYHKLRADNQATIPFTLAEQFRINPFLRTNDPNVQDAIAAQTTHSLSCEQDYFVALRAWKDRF